MYTSDEIRLRRRASQLHDLGQYALFQFIREITAASSGAFDVLERYARLDPAIVQAFGVEPPSLWRLK